MFNLLAGVRIRLPNENTAVDDKALQRYSLYDKAAVEFIEAAFILAPHRKVEDFRLFQELL